MYEFKFVSTEIVGITRQSAKFCLYADIEPGRSKRSASRHNIITKAINSFTDEYKVPFSMHVAGFKYHEIAEKMELPLGTVKSRIFFARQRLQEMLKDYK